jgi:hypothetical protein
LPADTVSVELVVGSQLPLLVTTVTLQSPSYAFSAAEAGAAARAPAAVKAEAISALPMRLRRMNQIPELV